jgi:hypothetical protein
MDIYVYFLFWILNLVVGKVMKTNISSKSMLLGALVAVYAAV